MSREQPPKLGYATRLPNDARAIPWTLAILSWLLLFMPWLADVLIMHPLALADSLRGARLAMSITIASGAGSIVCGAIGRYYAFKSGANVARWVAFVGSLFGIALLVTQSMALIWKLLNGRPL